MTMIPATLLTAARRGELYGRTLAVFVELHEWLDLVEYRVVRAWHIADQLGMSRSGVYETLEILVTRGYLERGEPIGTARTYRLTAPPAARAA